MQKMKEQREAGQSRVGFSLRLFFDPESGDVKFFQNVSQLSADYVALFLEDRTLQCQFCSLK
jgi:hypothetical protein